MDKWMDKWMDGLLDLVRSAESLSERVINVIYLNIWGFNYLSCLHYNSSTTVLYNIPVQYNTRTGMLPCCFLLLLLVVVTCCVLRSKFENVKIGRSFIEFRH